MIRTFSPIVYTVQLRITLDDDTGNDEEIRIEGLSVITSVDD